jgi:hypothetical protein
MSGPMVRFNVLVIAWTLAVAPTTGAEEPPQTPPNLARLSGWVKARTRTDRTLQIALLGCAPDARDRRLQSDTDGLFHLIVAPQGEGFVPIEQDTELIHWLRAAWPRITVWAVPTAQGHDELADEAMGRLTEQWLRNGEKQKPDVLIITRPVVKAGLINSPRFRKILLDCWRVGCLPIAVCEDDSTSTPPGILRVSPVSDRVLRSSKAAPDHTNWPVSLRLPESCLAGVFVNRDGDSRAATAYLTLATAALPVDKSPAILERASLLGLVSPVLLDEREEHRYYRVIDLDAAFNAKRRLKSIFWFTGRLINWNDKSGDQDAVFDITRCFRGEREAELRIITVLRPEVLLRHLAALEQLAQVRSISLARILNAPSFAVLRADDRLPFDFLGLSFEVIETLTSEEVGSGLPFISVARDAPIHINAANHP